MARKLRMASCTASGGGLACVLCAPACWSGEDPFGDPPALSPFGAGRVDG